VDSKKKRLFEAVLMVVKDKVLASVGIRMCCVPLVFSATLLGQQFGEFAKRRLYRTNIKPGRKKGKK